MSERVRRTRVKVCGVTRPNDVRHAIDCGADALGLVRVPASKRFVDLDLAAKLRGLMHGFVHCVALFLDPEADEVQLVIDNLQPNLLQFHGQESARFCEQFETPYIKALSQQDFARRQDEYHTAALLLIDSHSPGQLGGTGRQIDSDRFPDGSVRPLLLAGGLNPANVGDLIRLRRPYGLDVSSGLESAPGIKDRHKLDAFFRAVRLADCTDQCAH